MAVRVVHPLRARPARLGRAHAALTGVNRVPSTGPFMRFEIAVSTPSSSKPATRRYHQKFWRRSCSSGVIAPDVGVNRVHASRPAGKRSRQLLRIEHGEIGLGCIEIRCNAHGPRLVGPSANFVEPRLIELDRRRCPGLLDPLPVRRQHQRAGSALQANAGRPQQLTWIDDFADGEPVRSRPGRWRDAARLDGRTAGTPVSVRGRSSSCPASRPRG